MNTKILQDKHNLSKKLNYLMNKSLSGFMGENYYERFEIFNFIINNLKSLNSPKIYNEINYRLEEGENINSIFLEFLDKDEDFYSNLSTIKTFLEQFEHEDVFKRFFP